jgi:hypothetical protein
MIRTLLKLLLLVAAVGIPYIIFADGWRNALQEKWHSITAFASATSTRDTSSSSVNDVIQDSLQAPAAANESAAANLSGPPQPILTGGYTDNLLSVLRFDVSPEWVSGRWSRVSTTLAEMDLEGLRVPLVTGHDTDDLAGSLTYYFDHKRQVQRIAFDGYTGDPRPLIATVTQYYHLNEEPTLGAGLYLAKWNGNPTSMLRIRHSPVVRSEYSNSRYEVRLEINRPAVRYGLSAGALATLRQDDLSNRW